MRIQNLLFAALAATVLAGCTWETDLPPGADAIPVDPSRELLVVDDAVTAPLGGNADDAPLGFRHAVSALSLRDGATLRWLDAWSQLLRDEGRGNRAATLDRRVTCAWLRRDPANACDETCAACVGRALRLEDAPLRLVAVVNRTDLSVMPDRAADGGEGRLVYALTDGPADDPASPPLGVEVIFEYAQIGTALDWTRRWHALGGASEAAFPSALTDVASRFVDAGSIAQIRTADAWTGPMVLHQFEVASGEIVAGRVRDSPAWDRVSEAMLRDWAAANADAIDRGTAVMPSSWWASSSSPSDTPPAYLASMPRGDAILRQTCGGCHAQSASGFQIDPGATGAARLSRFLSDPTKDNDELRRRTSWERIELVQGGP